MVSIERHRDIRAFNLLMGIYSSGFPAAEPRESLLGSSGEATEPPEIVEEFEIDLTTWEITPTGPKAKSP